MTPVQAKDKVQWFIRILFRHSWLPAKDFQCINGRAKDILLQYGVSGHTATTKKLCELLFCTV